MKVVRVDLYEYTPLFCQRGGAVAANKGGTGKVDIIPEMGPVAHLWLTVVG